MAVLPAAVQASSSVPDSPVIRQDLARFDQALGLPAPPAFTIFFCAEAFRDITLGSNSFDGIAGFPAGTGWDAASGLGTANAAGLAGAVTRMTP